MSATAIIETPEFSVLTPEELAYALAHTSGRLDKEWLLQRNKEPLRDRGAAYFFKNNSTEKRGNGIYLFMGWDEWQPRNLRVIGLMDKSPFMLRRMTIEEQKDCHFEYRMKYHHYGNWEGLLEDEALMDVPAATIEEFATYREKYPLPPRKAVEKSKNEQLLLI